jgi:hypothetical protein
MPDVSSCVSGVPTFTDARLVDLEISKAPWICLPWALHPRARNQKGSSQGSDHGPTNAGPRSERPVEITLKRKKIKKANAIQFHVENK